jgi:hypothetical protein
MKMRGVCRMGWIWMGRRLRCFLDGSSMSWWELKTPERV